jgi:hypothetical protein
VESGIGTTLREARNRRKVDLSEVEEATKIRVRFLRAMENEEWDVLPGDTYARAFIRTYAGYLGLDGERLAEDYRAGGEPGHDRLAPRVEPALTPRRSSARSGARGRILAVVVAAALIGVLVALGLAGGDESGEDPAPAGSGPGQAAAREPGQKPAPGVALEIEATDEVWVCLLDGREDPLVNGKILAAGETEGPFRSSRFEVAFGNGAVEMEIDGHRAALPESSSPIGFAIDAEGELSELQEGERPDCT